MSETLTERLLQSVLETAPVVLFTLDPQGIFTRSEGRGLSDLGLKPGQVVGLSAMEVYRDAPQIVADIRRALQGEAFSTIVEVGGHTFETSYTPLRDAKGKLSGVLGISTDVTTAHQTQRALEQSQNFLNLVVENMPQSVFWKDRDLKFLGCNQIFARDAGKASPAELIGLDDYAMPWKEHAALYQQDDRQVIESGVARINFEEPHTSADGQVTWARTSKIPLRDKEGNVLAVLGLFEDITAQKQSEQALRESQERYRTVVDSMQDGLFVIQDARLVYVNNALSAILGAPVEKLQGMLFTEVIAAEDLPTVTDNYRRRQAGEAVPSEYNIHLVRLDDGKTILARFNANLVTYNGRIATMGTIRDITALSEAEKEATEWRQRYELVTAASGQIVYDYDIAGGGILWSGSVKTTLGYDLSEMNGGIEQWEDLIHPDDREHALQVLDAAEKSCSTYNVEYRFRCKDDRYIDMHDSGLFLADSNGKSYRMLGLMTDITQQKQAERTVRESEERYRNLFTHMQDGMFVIQDAKLRFVNQSFAAMIGYTPEELLEKNFAEIVAPEDLAGVVDNYRRRQAGEPVPSEYAFHMVHKESGERVLVNMSVGLIDYNGRVASMGTIKNITAQEEAEAERNRLLSILESSTDMISNATPDGTILYLNAAGRKILGLDPDADVSQMKIFATIPEWVQRRLMEEHIFEQALEKGAWSGEMALRSLVDGHEIPVSAIIMAHRSPSGEYAYSSVVARDISETKRVAQAVQESEERYRALVGHMQEGLFVIQDGKLRFVNESFANMMGSTVEDLTELDFIHIIAPEDAAGVAENYRRRQAGEDIPSSYEMHLIRRDNREHILINLNASLINYGGRVATMGTLKDITAERKAEEERSRLVNILESTTDMVTTGTTDGFATYFNAAGKQMLGIPPDADISQYKIYDFLPPWVQEKFLGPIFEQVSKQGLWSGEVAMQPLNGPEIPVSCIIMAHYTPEGQIGFVSTIARDITEQKRLERSLAETAQRRSYQVRVSTQVSQEIAAAPALDELFQRVVNQVKEQFGYYHTQLLRYEPGLNAVALITGYGEVGQKMLASGHRLSMGVGLIGTAAATGQTVLRPSLTRDPDWRPNPLLPETKGEIAVPIKLRDEVLGVLDVQSNIDDALSEEDQLMLEGLCGQIAIAIDSTRLRLEMEGRLNEINALYRATSQEGWQSFSQTTNINKSYLYNRVDTRPAPELWEPQIKEAVEQKKLVAGEQSAPVVAPLTVRGEVIGALGVYDDPQNPLTPEDLALINEVSDQVALALEGARLFEQTRVALQETEQLYNFTRRINTAANPQEVLAVVVEEMHVTDIDRAVLMLFERNLQGDVENVVVHANWYDGIGQPPTEVGTRYSVRNAMGVDQQFSRPESVFIDDADAEFRARGVESTAMVPLWVGNMQIGAIYLETTRHHTFTEAEKRLIVTMSQQMALAVQSRLLFERTQANEAQLAEALAIARMAYWEFDVASGMFIFNDRFYEMIGTTVEKEGGYLMAAETYASKYVAPESAEQVGKNIQAALETNDPNFFLQDEARQFNGAGEEMYVTIRFRVQKDAEGRTIRLFGANQDITESKRAEQALARRAAELATVAKVTTTISTILEPETMLQTVVDLTRQNFGLYHAHIYLVDEASQTLSLVSGSGEVGRKMVAEGRAIPLDAEKSLVVRAYRSGQGIIVNDVHQDPDFLPHPLLPDTHSEMAVPMSVGGRVLGVIDVQSETTGRFSNEDVNILTTLSAQVAVSLQNARSYARAQRQAEREALINAISEKIQSTATVENALQVSIRELGRALGAQRTIIQLGLDKPEEPKGPKR